MATAMETRSQYHHQQHKRHLREFHHKTKMLLTDTDREFLYNILKDFKFHQRVDTLVHSLRIALDTPAKLDLLKDIRRFIPSVHIADFDRIAPYHKMAHPFRSQSHLSINSLGRQNRTHPNHQPAVSQYGTIPRISIKDFSKTGHTSADPLIAHAPTKVITVVKQPHEHLGFSVRGGSEHGLGIYVSEVDWDSAADHAGLHVGDNIIEVNSVSFDNIASSSAVKVLTGSNKLKMILRRIGKVPSFKSAKEKTSWYDTSNNRVIDGTYEDHGTLHYPTGLAFVDGVIERRIQLSISKENHQLGFNIRGGCEYGLGIYVSHVDPGGLAEQKGLKVGDQIIETNGESFEDISHARAVEILREPQQLVMLVRDVGKYPAFKEIYAEYSWVDGTTGTVSKSSSGKITSVPVQTSMTDSELTTRETFTEFPMESRVESFVQTEDELDEGITSELMVTPRKESFSQTEAGTSFFFSDMPPHSGSTAVVASKANDVVMVERLTESTVEKSPKKSKAKKMAPDKPNLAIIALQNEANTERVKAAKKKDNVDKSKVSSLRGPNDINPRKNMEDEQRMKKSRSFRQLLFGTKSKGKNSESKPKRSRQPLSSVDFTGNKTEVGPTHQASSNGKDGMPVFSHGMGSQMMLQHTMSQKAKTARIEQTAKRILNEDECTAINRHIANYEHHKKVEALAGPLLAILDTPEKMVLMREIRDIIQPTDIAKFDSMVSNKEVQAYRELKMRQPKNKTDPSDLLVKERIKACPQFESELDKETKDDINGTRSETLENSKCLQMETVSTDDMQQRSSQIAWSSKRQIEYYGQENIVSNLVVGEKEEMNFVQKTKEDKRTESQTEAGLEKMYFDKIDNIESWENESKQNHGGDATFIQDEFWDTNGIPHNEEVVLNSYKLFEMDDFKAVDEEIQVISPMNNPEINGQSNTLTGHQLQNKGGLQLSKTPTNKVQHHQNKSQNSKKNVPPTTQQEWPLSVSRIYPAITKQGNVTKIQVSGEIMDSNSWVSDAKDTEEVVFESNNSPAKKYSDHLDKDYSPKVLLQLATENTVIEESKDMRQQQPSVGDREKWAKIQQRNQMNLLSADQEVHVRRPRSNSRVYKALIVEDIKLQPTEVTGPANKRHSYGGYGNTHSANGMIGDKNESQRRNTSTSLSLHDLNPEKTVVEIAEENPEYAVIRKKDKKKRSPSDNNIMSTFHGSKKSENEHGSLEALNFLDNLSDGEENTPPGSPKSVRSIDSAGSGKEGSYSVNGGTSNWSLHNAPLDLTTDDLPVEGSTDSNLVTIHSLLSGSTDSLGRKRTEPPVFVAPPPPKSPPPSNGEDLGWQEWITLDNSNNTIYVGPEQVNSSDDIEPDYQTVQKTISAASERLDQLVSEQSDSRIESIQKRPLPETPKQEDMTYMLDQSTELTQKPNQSSSPKHKADPDFTPKEILSGPITVVLSKNHRTLGMSISGGSDSRTQPRIKIAQIFQGGSAEIEGTLQVGMFLLAVDGHDLEGATHGEAVEVIRKCYSDKRDLHMEVLVVQP